MASIRGILNIQSLNELTSEKRNESESPDNERSHSIVTIPRPSAGPARGPERQTKFPHALRASMRHVRS